MYKAQDDLGTSYYYRGAVDNNWVKFGKVRSGEDIYWRIIRVNGDGSIRMIYTGTIAPTESTKVVMTGEDTQIIKYPFNNSYDKAEYVGYVYNAGNQYGNWNSSPIKNMIEDWYKTTTLETDSATKTLVSQDQIFCNDRSPSSTQTAAWTSTGADYYYGAHGRLVNNKTPILTCPTASDKLTANTSNDRGALTYPVGLITADEVAMAGGVYGFNNNNNCSYYLHTNQNYWTGSPFNFKMNKTGVDGTYTGNAFMFVEADLKLSYTLVLFNSYGVRPVISLSSKAKLSGSGTYNDVYTVS